MKLRKRIGSLFLSLVLMLGLMTASSTAPTVAAATPALTVENQTAAAGATCTVAVKLTNAAGVYSGNFTLQYDNSLLTAESFTFGSIFNDHTKNCNLDYQSKGNLIRVTYSGAYALTGDGTLITFTFKAKQNASGAAALQFNAYKLYNENGEALTGTVSGGSVTVAGSAAAVPRLSLTGTAATAGQTVTVPVIITDAAGVYSGNFTLQYDNSLLTAESFTFGNIFNDHTKNCNLDYQSKGNLIRVTYSGAYALTGDGTLITFTFKAKQNASGAAALQFNAYKLYNENGEALTGTASGGAVTVTAPAAPTLTSLSIVKGPTKTAYTVGESLNTAGLTVQRNYSDGTHDTLTSGYTLSGFDSTTAGTKIVTVSYGGKSAAFTVTVTPPAGTDPGLLTVSNGKACVGKTLDLTVNVMDNPGFAYLKIALDYDKTALELLDVDNGTVATDSFSNEGDVMLWDSSADMKADGRLVTLHFGVRDGAAAGTYAVSVQVRECYDQQERDVPFSVNAGLVTVTDVQYGDANGDGEINGKDVIRLRRYLLTLETSGAVDVEVFDGADANGDGVINGKDLIRLRNYLVNYDEETGTSPITLGP